MGYSYAFNCRECSYSQNLYEGWRFMPHDQTANSILQSTQVPLHYKTRHKITQLLQGSKNIRIVTEYRIYRCLKCLQISDKLYVRVTLDEKVLHETKFRCANCNIGLKHTNIHRLKFAICPKCKSRKFEKSKELMIWD